MFKLIFTALCFLGISVQASPLFQNIQTYKSNLGFLPYYQKKPQRKLKIAVLDKGFYGYQDELGKSLPANAQYFAGPVISPEDLKVEHGLKMAQILMAMLTNDNKASQWIPELYLYNVFGFTNFKAAIEDLMTKQVDLVLYSEVWEYGGNNDGKGFINAEVNKATAGGVIWVNAAGNYNTATFNSPISTASENWVSLPDENQALKFYCQYQDKSQKCQVKIVLSWNDFKDDVNLGTQKDLDMALTDDMLNIIQTSALKQSDDINEIRPGYSKYPREIITADLNPGSYFIRVKNRSNNFSNHDKLRISIDGLGAVLARHSVDETMLNPADNASVITVGASDSNRSSQSRKLFKPDLLAPSSLILGDGLEVRGSSNSAAIVASGVAILKGLNPHRGSQEILQLLKNQDGDNWSRPGFSLNYLGFWFTGPNCFFTYNPTPQQLGPFPLEEILNRGGVFVQTSTGVKIMTPFDPIDLLSRPYRNSPNDMIAVTPQGMALFMRFGSKPYESVEVFQRPLEAGLCPTHNGDLPNSARQFHLPHLYSNPI
jgi:hypothetical protein